MMTKIDITGLLDRSMAGDVQASREILELQRQGRALRLYPLGRKGPLDEGYSPLIIERDEESGLIRMERLKPAPLLVPRRMLAKMMKYHVYMCGLIWVDYSEHEDPLAASEALVDKDLTYKTWFTESKEVIGLMFFPERNVVEYGISMTRRFIGSWLEFIEQSDMEYSEFGFDDEDEYFDMLEFADSPSTAS